MSDPKLIHKHSFENFKAWHLIALLIPSVVFTFLLVFSSRASLKNYEQVAAESKVAIEYLQVKLGDTYVLAQVSDTPHTRKVGLSAHDSLEKNQGMLFVFEKEDVHPVRFWMVGMNFPLDLIWINDGKIVQIDENTRPQPENTPTNQVVFYPSYQPIDQVLEVNAGFVAENDLEIGTPVEFIRK